MWFKNIRVYTLEQAFEYTEEKLESLLKGNKFSPCSGQDMEKIGWVNVLSEDSEALVHKIGNDYFFRCRFEKKMLPTSVINEELQEKVEALELAQCRTIKKKEKSDLKEQIITNLLPRAFAIHKEHWIWINSKYRYVIVSATSDRIADTLTSLLRKSLGTLPCKPFVFKNDIPEVLTEWLSTGKTPVGIEIGDETELQDIDGEGASIKAKKQDLSSEEIKVHLDAGKVCTSLSLIIHDDISFLLDSKFNLKKIKLSDTLVDENTSISNDPAARLDADLALMAGEYCKIIPVLIDAFGGEADE